MFEQVWVYCMEGNRMGRACHSWDSFRLLGRHEQNTLCTYYKKPCIGDVQQESHRDSRLNWLQGYSIYLKIYK
jgi:hypothetical protein